MRYRIIHHEGAHGPKYYPQVRRWFVWHNILPDHEPACGSLRLARGVIFISVEAGDARRAHSVVEMLDSNDRSKWVSMAVLRMDPPNMPEVAALPGHPLADVPLGGWPQAAAPVNRVEPTQPWPRDAQWPPEGHHLLEGVKQPDPYILVPWPWRWLARFRGKRQAQQEERRKSTEQLLREVFDAKFHQMFTQELARQMLLRYRPRRSQRPEQEAP